ncbi:MAG: LysR family transcriptional regulator [Proteobacteria bacterium]|nr:LysR family transcriptional regulator [Pseudomonadota bacterium]
MWDSLNRLTALRTFYAVARGGGIAEGASQLNVTTGAVRYQIRQLEAELGVELMVRSQRALTLTVPGTELYQKLGSAFDEIHLACRTTQHGRVEGELRIACAPAFAALRLMRLLDLFLQRFPSVTVKQLPIEQADETLDVIMSFGERDIPGRRTAILRNETYFPLCSAELFYRSPVKTIHDLQDHVLIHGDSEEDWPRLLRASGRGQIVPRQHVYMPNSHLALEAAKEGCGIAVGSTILCADDLRRGTLVKVLDLEIPAPHPYFVIRPGDTASPLADAFADLLIEQLERA